MKRHIRATTTTLYTSQRAHFFVGSFKSAASGLKSFTRSTANCTSRRLTPIRRRSSTFSCERHLLQAASACTFCYFKYENAILCCTLQVRLRLLWFQDAENLSSDYAFTGDASEQVQRVRNCDSWHAHANLLQLGIGGLKLFKI